MTLYLNKPTYLHNSVHSYFSNLTKALEHQNESDAKTIDNCGSALENHTFDSLKALIEKPTSKLRFILHPEKTGTAVSGTEVSASKAPAVSASTGAAEEEAARTAAAEEAAARAAPPAVSTGTGTAAVAAAVAEPAAVVAGTIAAGTLEEPAELELGGGGRVKRTRNLRNRGNNKSQKQRKRKHLNYTKK